MTRFLGLVIVAGLISFALSPVSVRAAPAQRPAYRAFGPALRESSVPVLLPARFPPAVGHIESIAVLSAGSNGYDVAFAAVPRCSGARSCAIFHVAGYPPASLAGRAFGYDRPVRLPDGARGFYSPRNCAGASCTEASLSFKRDGSMYEIDADVARDSLPTLVAIYGEMRCVVFGANAAHGRCDKRKRSQLASDVQPPSTTRV